MDLNSVHDIRPRRVLQFIDTLGFGGAESVLINLSIGLRDQGFEITVGHFGNPWLSRRCDDEQLPQIIISGYRWYKSSLSLPAFVVSFAKFLRTNQFDIVHAHLYGPTVAASAAGWLVSTPVVGTLHDSYTLTERPRRIRLLQLAAVFGTQLVSVAGYMERSFKKIGYFKPGVWSTIHNGIDSQRFRPGVNNDDLGAAREASGLPARGVLVGSVGRLVSLKRFEQLIKAFNKSGIEGHLIIIGDGPEKEFLLDLINQLGASAKVHLLGQRDDIEKLLPLIDLFALWSETEGLSCSVAEAMSCGLPSVVSDVGGNHELISDGQTGYLVDATDLDALTKRLVLLASNVNLRKQLGSAAHQQIVRKFSIDTMTDAYSVLLDPGRIAQRK
jgi:glycosyltransferase involved in cell wall biosynthesis